MVIFLHKKFKRKYEKLNSSQKVRFKERIEIFLRDPYNSILHNHALQGDYLGFRSINITGGLRVHYEELSSGGVLFITVGTHSELYG
ncbi:MAG TPA: type II toxin-antitoxin system mRNA interferase toxin, RelE/StbE family [Candidatus Paceibacterota bacterium]